VAKSWNKCNCANEIVKVEAEKCYSIRYEKYLKLNCTYLKRGKSPKGYNIENISIAHAFEISKKVSVIFDKAIFFKDPSDLIRSVDVLWKSSLSLKKMKARQIP
jgi:hypothetical protein